jgi:hypothetical protein
MPKNGSYYEEHFDSDAKGGNHAEFFNDVLLKHIVCVCMSTFSFCPFVPY